LALMVLFGLFHLLKLARACTSSDKPEKVLCRFTDACRGKPLPPLFILHEYMHQGVPSVL